MNEEVSNRRELGWTKAMLIALALSLAGGMSYLVCRWIVTWDGDFFMLRDSGLGFVRNIADIVDVLGPGFCCAAGGILGIYLLAILKSKEG